MTMTPEQRKQAALKLAPGQCLKVVQARQWAVYLRRLASGRWAVLAGWRTEEAVGDDAGSQHPVAGLEGIVHEARDYDFGADLDAALDYYGVCVEACHQRRVPPTLTLEPATA